MTMVKCVSCKESDEAGGMVWIDYWDEWWCRECEGDRLGYCERCEHPILDRDTHEHYEECGSARWSDPRLICVDCQQKLLESGWGKLDEDGLLHEIDITERLSALSRKLCGLGIGTKQAAKILEREEWDDHWPTAAPSRDARYGYVYDGGLMESGDPANYYNINDEAMVLVCDVDRNHYDKFTPCCQQFGGGCE